MIVNEKAVDSDGKILQKVFIANEKISNLYIHTPTCSQCAIEAIERYGALKGSYLTTKRILRCNPFAKGGYDPVP